MEFPLKEARFDIWCQKCVNANTKDTDEPCNSCLANPVNEHSTKPVEWKEKANA